MSINLFNHSYYDDAVVLSGYFDGNNKIFFSFIHDTIIENNVYRLFINDTEMDTKSVVYLVGNDSEYTDSLIDGNQYYIHMDDIDTTNLKLDVHIINRDIILEGFDNMDGVYKYLYETHYKSDGGHYLTKEVVNDNHYWHIYDNNYDNNYVIKYVSATNDYNIHPSFHTFESVTHEYVINIITINNNSLNVSYDTDYGNYINS
jgi:hypothetical protein